ncbi:unnamed protein product, partial [Sphacelaria rigidula]
VRCSVTAVLRSNMLCTQHYTVSLCISVIFQVMASPAYTHRRHIAPRQAQCMWRRFVESPMQLMNTTDCHDMAQLSSRFISSRRWVLCAFGNSGSCKSYFIQSG